MGYSQGKMIKPEEIQHQSLIDSKETSLEKIDLPFQENYKIISKTTKNNVACKIIEFTSNENKQIDCEISLNKINFEEAYEMDFIFDSVLKVFENMGINFPLVIYLNFENSRINIFLKLKSIDEIIVITNKFISLIKNFNKLMKFTNDIDYKVHKKPEIQSNYSPLNSNNTYINHFNNPNSNKNEKINTSINNDSEKKKSLINDGHVNFENKQLKSSTNNFVEISTKNGENYNISNMKNHNLNSVEEKNKYSNTKKRSLTFDNFCEIGIKVYEFKPNSTIIPYKINKDNNIINNDSCLKSKDEIEIKDEENALLEDKKFKLTEELTIPRLRIETEADETFLPIVLDKNFESFTYKNSSKNINEELINNQNNIEKNEKNKFHKIDLQKGDIDLDSQNQKASSDSKIKISEYSQEELERMYFLSSNEDIFDPQNFIMDQPKEEVDKLLKDLLINQNIFPVADNLLLNSNFLNSDIDKIGLSFDDEENVHNGDFINSTSNNIVDNTIKGKINTANNFNANNSYLAFENNNLKQNSFNGKEQKLADNPNQQDGEFENANVFDLKAKNEKKENRSEENLDFENKINEFNKNYMKDEKSFQKSEINKKNQKNKKIEFSNYNFANNNQNNLSSIHNNFVNNNNKYMNKIKFPKIQDSFNQNQYNNKNSNNNNFINDYQNHSKQPGNILLNNTNNLDNTGINFQRTRNYYINNILNFNPNNNSNYDNFKNQNTANINAMLNPNLINHNMLLMMKKINQNIPNNPSIGNNMSHIQTNNLLANKNLTNYNYNNLNNQLNLNTSINTHLNNNIICKSEVNYNNAFINPTNKQIHDDKSHNFFVNTGFIYSDNNNQISKRDENSNLYNNNNMSKEFEEKVDYLEEKIKLISVNEDSLEGFYFKKFDYISDEEFFSFYLIGNINNLKYSDDSNFKKIQQDYSENKENKERKIEKENYIQTLAKFFNETLKLKLKHIIQNPSESENIARLIFYKNKYLYTGNNNNDYNIINEIDGLEHKKIEIMNSSFIFIRIKSLVFKLHPEELYADLQIKVTYETNNFDEQDFVNYIENSLQLEFYEISFITQGECIITFYEKEKLKHLAKVFNEKPFHQIKRPLKKTKIETFFLNEPFPIYGNKINILYEDDFTKVDFAKRPPESFRVVSGNYIPSLKKLMLSKNLWNSFKIEKNNFNIVNVEQFQNEISISDIEKLKIAYTEKMSEKNNRKQNVYSTIVEYNKPQIDKNEIYDCFNKNKLRKIIRDEDSQNHENLNLPNEKPKQKIFSTIKTKARKTELESEVEFSSNENSESSFSLKNFEESDLDLDEDNSYIDNYYTSNSEKSEIIRVKKRGRKRKSELNSNINIDNNDLNKFHIINKTRSPCLSSNNYNNNNYGKKFINSFKRSYNHSRYSANNLELESSIDPNRPNILDELIKNDLDDQEKCLLEKLEKDVQDKIFNKNTSNTNYFMPKKRGRKPRTENLNVNTIGSSDKKTILTPYLSNKVLLRNRKDSKIYKENSESENEENESFKQQKIDKQENKYFKEAISETEYETKNCFIFGKEHLKENKYQYSNENKSFENPKKESFINNNVIGIIDKTNSHNNYKMKEMQTDDHVDESEIKNNNEENNLEDLKKKVLMKI